MDEAVRGAAGLVGTCAFTPAQDVTLFSDSSRLWGSPASLPGPPFTTAWGPRSVRFQKLQASRL